MEQWKSKQQRECGPMSTALMFPSIRAILERWSMGQWNIGPERQCGLMLSPLVFLPRLFEVL